MSGAVWPSQRPAIEQDCRGAWLAAAAAVAFTVAAAVHALHVPLPWAESLPGWFLVLLPAALLRAGLSTREPSDSNKRWRAQLEAIFEHGLEGKALVVRDAVSGMPVVTRVSSGWVALVAPEEGVMLHDSAYLPSIFSADNLAIIKANMTLLETQGTFESTIHHR